MAGISVVFFAHLRESLGESELTIAPEMLATKDSDGLIHYLTEALPEFATYTESQAVLIAVNQSLINTNTEINAGDVVALFPPVTGG